MRPELPSYTAFAQARRQLANATDPQSVWLVTQVTDLHCRTVPKRVRKLTQALLRHSQPGSGSDARVVRGE